MNAFSTIAGVKEPMVGDGEASFGAFWLSNPLGFRVALDHGADEDLLAVVRILLIRSASKATIA